MNNPAEKWAADLSQWAIPAHIMEQAPESPWIHPPAMFTLPEQIPNSPSHDRAREAIAVGGSVLDIGCGGGIAAFAVSPPAKRVVGVDHQTEMLEMFAQTAASKDLAHVEVFGDWPAVADQTPIVDVVTCHHVVYNVADIEAFLLALDSHATKRVVIELPQEHPLSTMRKAWMHFWKLERPTKPSPDDLIAVLTNLGIKANLELWTGPKLRAIDLVDEIKFLRIRLCLDSSRDFEIREFIENQEIKPFRALATIWWDKVNTHTP